MHHPHLKRGCKPIADAWRKVCEGTDLRAMPVLPRQMTDLKSSPADSVRADTASLVASEGGCPESARLALCGRSGDPC
jgi:hypothetical protein